ncbi:alpha/beta fold hydrolase [Zavarzinia sp. CC-PAN008]|uniref:alpha/beta fold hydrolase n=1 Tax=Zavarzinia sp. CC-PAN008 TaxID=3243332 RepID=UPI003F7467AB
MATFVLVHGAWHGGWCWYKVVPLLEALGHRVLAPDLPGHGIKGQATRPTLAEYRDSIVRLVEGEAEPVVLVGHSMGGIVISAVAEAVPDRIARLVYLCAFLVPAGQTLMEAAAGDAENLLPGHILPTEDGTAVQVAYEILKPAFYADCPDADIALARLLLVPQSAEPVNVPMAVTPDRFGRVPRAYVECTADKAIGITKQRSLHAALPCDRVVTLDTSHSPFFSAPDRLAHELAGLAA